MKTNTTRAIQIIAVLLCCGALLATQPGCSGGGGGGPVAETPAAQTIPNAEIAGKVAIAGVTDYSGVVVVAEKTANGTTARVAAMMSQAQHGERMSARQALAASDVYTATTESDGAFKLTVPEGDYTVSAFKQDALAAQPITVKARAAAAVTVNFDLIATGKVAGTFSMPASLASSTQIIFAYLEGTSFAAYADTNGAYTISNVPIGTYNIVFVIGSNKHATHTGIAVTAGTTTSTTATNFTMVCNARSDCQSLLGALGACQNGFTEQSSCTTIACDLATDCNDNNTGTNEVCDNGGTLNAVCHNYLPTRVISFSPANGATNVPYNNAQFKVVFDRGMTNSNTSFYIPLCFKVEKASNPGTFKYMGGFVGYTAYYSYPYNGYTNGMGTFAWSTTNVSNDTFTFTVFSNAECVHSGYCLEPNTIYTIQSVNITNCGGTGNELRDIYNFPPDLSDLPTSGSFTTAP